MKKLIYLATFIEFALIVAGVDWYFGKTVRDFCRILLPIWLIRFGAENVESIKKLFGALYK